MCYNINLFKSDHFLVSWNYITLHYITLHYITLHYITLHYITLHYITLHYITLLEGFTMLYKYKELCPLHVLIFG